MDIKVIISDPNRGKSIESRLMSLGHAVSLFQYGYYRGNKVTFDKDKKSSDVLLVHVGEANPESTDYIIEMQSKYKWCIGFTGATTISMPCRKESLENANFKPVVVKNVYYAPQCSLIKNYELTAGFRNLLNRMEKVIVETGEPSSINILEFLEKPFLAPLSILKHRIAHLFLSMDVDLQGIGVLRKQVAEGVIQNAANTPEAYLRDVLNNKEKDYYRQKLADLQFFVAKVSGGKKKPFLQCDGEPSGDLVRPTLSESNLPDDKAIVDLVLEGNRDDDSVIRFWSTLLNLSGLKANDAKPFENINPDTNSSIFEFMCLMDCKVDKKNDINEQDVNDVMKIEGGKVWTVEGANPSPIKCFNDWFCALVDCLEKLSKMIKSD